MGSPHDGIDRADGRHNQLRFCAACIDDSHGDAQIPVGVTTDGTGQIKEPKTALLDQGLNSLTFHCSVFSDGERSVPDLLGSEQVNDRENFE